MSFLLKTESQNHEIYEVASRKNNIFLSRINLFLTYNIKEEDKYLECSALLKRAEFCFHVRYKMKQFRSIIVILPAILA